MEPFSPPSDTDLAKKAPRALPWGALGLGLVSSAVFLWLSVQGIDWEHTAALLQQVDLRYVALYILVACFIQGLRMARWSLQLHSLGESSWFLSLPVGAIGLTAIFFLPARLGEFVRPAMIAKMGPVSLGEATASVVSERLIDGLLVGGLLIATGFWIQNLSRDTSVLPDLAEAARAIQYTGWGIGGFFLSATIGVWLVALQHRRVAAMADALLPGALAMRIGAIALRFHEGLKVLMATKHLALYVGLSVLLWGLSGWSLAPLFIACDAELPLVAAFVVLGATSVGILVPAGPASMGPFHFAVLWSLGLFGVSAEVGFSIAVLYHLSQVLANALVGILGALFLSFVVKPSKRL